MEVQILWAMPVHLAQLVERQTFNLVVAGSSPAVDIFYPIVPIAQMVERLFAEQ